MAVQAKEISIATADGVMPAHLALPAGPGPHPAVIVIMEAFGLVKHIRAVADRLAEEGYAALAPDFYYREGGPRSFGYDQLGAALEVMNRVDDAKFTGDLRAAVGALRALPEVGPRAKVGVTGFCMGGRLAFLAACALPGEFAAVASFYGGGVTGHLAQAGAIRCPLRLFFGGRDAYIPQAQVDEIDRCLREQGKDYKIQLYAEADHGFFCDERSSYAPLPAELAWRELREFFAVNLK